MKIHELKVDEGWWPGLERGEKTFEVRRDDDRGFEAGDLLVLRCWTGADWATQTHPIVAKVTYVLRGGQFGIEPGHVVMAIRVLR